MTTPVTKVSLAVYATLPGIAQETRAGMCRLRIGLVRGNFLAIKSRHGLPG